MRFLRKFKRYFSCFQTKLVLAFLFATLLPLIFIASVSCRISYRIAEDKILTSTLMSDRQITAQINDRLSQVESAADSIFYQVYALEHNSYDMIQALEMFSSVRNFVSLYKSMFGFYHIFIFLQPGQIGAEEGLYFFTLDKLSELDLDHQILEAAGSSSYWTFRQDISLPYVLSHGKTSVHNFLCLRTLNNRSTGTPEYAYCIVLEAEEFSQKLQTYGQEEITSYILNDDGQIVAHSDVSLNGKTLDTKKYEQILTASESPFYYNGVYYSHETLNNGWIHVTEIPGNYIRSNTQILIQTIFWAMIIFIPLTVAIIILFSRSLSGRLQNLSHAMNSFQLGDSPDHLKIVTVPHPKDPDLYDEIDMLGLTFENMQRTIARNLKSIVNLSLSEERLKYQLLQSQINPHFLYNILGTIHTCQALGKFDVASQMITNLSSFYRMTLRKSTGLIAIRDELEIARLYLNIEKLCHGDCLDWKITVEDGVENFMICKFTLQPFLENAILHGLSENISVLHISIEAVYGEDTVVITIQDDGCGITPDTLGQLHYALKHKIVNYEKHFGISNVNARISSPLFGGGTVEIDSEVGKGTLITIIFQQMEGINEESHDR